MNPLERRLIVISRLAAKGDELFSARPHVLLVIERDAARKVALAMILADVRHRIASTRLVVGTVVVANGSSLVSSHHATAQEAPWPLSAS
jgi:hypothetical protein